ncbi:MAG: transposase, partial [Candidatus Cloacimonetes bacterium]|nr:transposase [Candidatus Cloacimonadota bacterium]
MADLDRVGVASMGKGLRGSPRRKWHVAGAGLVPPCEHFIELRGWKDPRLIIDHCILVLDWADRVVKTELASIDLALDGVAADVLAVKQQAESVPDHSTICRFRNKLIEAKLHDKIFEE